MGMLENFNRKKVFIAAHDRRFPAGTSKPEYKNKESGVCLIVGTHPCSDSDVDAALTVYPNAKICVVNEATALIPAHHLATYHGDKIELFMKLHDETWDGIYGSPVIHLRDLPEAKTERPCYRWDINYGGGSAMFAAAVMERIGFDLIIFCGCPMDGGGGYAIPTNKGTPDDPRIGYIKKDHSIVDAWRLAMYELKELRPDISSKLRSMSGFSKSLFGGIEQ